MTAIQNVVERIQPALLGMDACDFRKIDQRMIDLDGTHDKSRLGANSIYAVSVAVARLGAKTMGVPLYTHVGQKNPRVPIPCFNVINGGTYCGVHQPFQEFLVVPDGARSFAEAVRIGAELFEYVRRAIAERQGNKVAVGHYSGHAAFSSDPEEILGLLTEVTSETAYGDRVSFALDCAASSFYDVQRQAYRYKDGWVDTDELIGGLSHLVDSYRVLFIEDPLQEDDFAGFARARNALPTIVAGDDLIATNPKRLQAAIEANACGAMVFKPNQVGTITEALEAMEILERQGLIAIASGRAGGVLDDPIADMAVGVRTDLIKTGAPRSGERTHIINALLSLEERNDMIMFAGASRIHAPVDSL